jgi:hypothetical protein
MKKMNNIAGSWKSEVGSRKTEAGRRLPAGQAGKLEAESSCFLTCNSNFLASLSHFIKGDESRFIGTEGVRNPKPETLKENKEYRITLPGLLTGNVESGSWKTEDWRPKFEAGRFSGTPVPHFLFLISYFLFLRNGKINVKYPIINNQYSTMNQQPLARSQKLTASGKKYKTPSRLPQEEGFYSGDCPGAAAITILTSLFSSPRVSLNFAGVRRHALSGSKPLSAYQPTALPVKNQQALHQGSFVPLEKGDEIRPLVAGSEGVETPWSTRKKGFKAERRYAYVLN